MMNESTQAFVDEIAHGLIGPGTDVFGGDPATELVSDYPLNRYYSAILFPQKTFTGGMLQAASEEEGESAQGAALSGEQNYNEDVPYDSSENTTSSPNGDEPENETAATAAERTSEDEGAANSFFPSYAGFTFCVDSSVKTMPATFSFGLYESLTQPSPDIRIRISEEGYAALMDTSPERPLPFREALRYEGGFMWLARSLTGQATSPRHGEFRDWDLYVRHDNIGKHPAYQYIHLVDKLLRRLWRRMPVEITADINVSRIGDSPMTEIFSRKTGAFTTIIKYQTKVYLQGERKYIKLLLVNASRHPAAKYSNTNEGLNKKCIFQAGITVTGVPVLPYKSHTDLHPFDKEQNEINFLYRSVKSYGVGHNCSVEWFSGNGGPESIRTTFLPVHRAQGMKNSFGVKDFDSAADFEAMERCLAIRSLSHFNEDDTILIQSLRAFTALYGQWINGQIAEAATLNNDEARIAQDITSRQAENLRRMTAGVDMLQHNPNALRCFRLANTAMFIQFIISHDVRFGKTEKELDDNGVNVDQQHLEFFRDYNEWQCLPGGLPPTYRPFQLAFLLLSLTGIVDNQSADRKEIVDLIWFPTGGGKTEAYLAVSAFTILWRRIANSAEASRGTSIIMRYTLRLLTSQQFERASRVILALDFLRKNFEDEIGSEPVSIGLWVGRAAAPNSIADADAILEQASRDYAKAGPHTSALQLTACPWCGTKFITQDSGGSWQCGYEAEGGARGYFHFKCVNVACAFHGAPLPVQVVDEMLYKQPPTLLFATADKFAILASQKDGAGACFFNTFTKDLPPDLIIQDELHLMSGPLGSVAAIFESVVEYLCSAAGRKPKIIASTATTRNTDRQVKELYGPTRRVNVFPPSGLSYQDSFFAREVQSNRTYVGFMPTGKSGITTQLWLLSSLLHARVQVATENHETLDNYWTVVSYYHSLRDVGRIFNKVSDEIQTSLRALFYRKYGNSKRDEALLTTRIADRTLELTSRMESTDIKATLRRLEESLQIDTGVNGGRFIKDGLDLVLASNMISVGIDVSRLNIMLMNGMPQNVAEYIQASSRVARRDPGLVFTLCNPSKAREKSYFENFSAFHQAYYRYVEPLSLTAYTENTIRKMCCTMLLAFLRNSIPELSANSGAQAFESRHAEIFRQHLIGRFGPHAFLDDLLTELTESWLEEKAAAGGSLTYKALMKFARNDSDAMDDVWLTMESLRDIDTETYYQITEPQHT